MSNAPRNTVPPLLTALLAGVAMAAWAAWLGWDQHRDVHPDGSTTGPYEAWQVIGLVLTLLVPVSWAAFRNHVAAAVVGTTAGLTIAAAYDWSDDATGLFGVGVALVLIGSLAVTGAVANLIALFGRAAAGRGPRR
ncbi:hypothetical protein OG625_35875 [Streptomyces sp. NBC_01351]|uniref:hypothetical protein n=1 Tax=Streptomyces sp. NBC_01351 TaxID=2903833 RepID=UPI002E37DC94|nr:hypothetical protein [Streptomyces sp. NBC_01351]